MRRGPGADGECSGGRVDGVSGRPYLRGEYWWGAWEGHPIAGSLSDPVPNPHLRPHCLPDLRPVGMGSSGGEDAESLT